MAVRVVPRKRDGATVYYAFYRGPDRRQVTWPVRTVPSTGRSVDHARARAAAENYANEQAASVESGTWIDPRRGAADRITFGDLVKRFLCDYRPGSGDPAYYEGKARTWLTFFGNVPVIQIDALRVEKFRNARARSVSPSTVRKDLISLGTLFRWAMGHDLVTTNPAEPWRVKRPPQDKPDPRPFTDEQVEAMVAGASDWFAPMVEFASETGADFGEVHGLEWRRHVDRGRRVLRLPRQKTDVPRTIPYGDNARLRSLLAAAAIVRHASGRVFLRADGQPVKREAARTAMRRLLTATIGPWPRPWKSLRATFATRQAERGTPIPVIAALMGLKTAYVLDHYIKPSGLLLRDAMADQTEQKVLHRA